MKKIILVPGLFLMVLVTTASYSSAAFELIPSVSVREEYNDNIFLARSDKEDDFITTIFPKIELQYTPNRTLDLNLDYGLRFKFYSDHSDLDDTSLRETQDADFEAHVRPLNRFAIDISDRYEKVQVDVRDPVAEDNVFFNKTERNTFLIAPHYTIPVTPSVSSTVGYEYTNVWHRDDDDQFSDYEDHYAYVALNKKFSAKFEGLVKYAYESFLPEEDRVDSIDKYDRQEASAELTYRPNTKVEITGEIGEAWTDFKDEDDKYSNPFGSFEASYSFGSTEIAGGYIYSFEDSPTAGAFKRQRIDVNLTTGRTYSLSLNPYYSWDKYFNVERKDNIGGLSLSVSRSLSQKIDAFLDASAERQKFLPEDRKVNRYSLGSRFAFRVRRNVTASVGYRFNKRDSNDGTDEFDNNIAWLQAEVIF